MHGAVTPAARERWGSVTRSVPEAELKRLPAPRRPGAGRTASPPRGLPIGALRSAADAAFDALTPEDCRGLPRSPAHRRPADTATTATAHAWSSAEQSRVKDADPATREELARLNAEYEAKFGHIYIVCATGKSAEEMLAIARERIQNDAKTELARAGDEQRKITAIRLDKLVRGER